MLNSLFGGKNKSKKRVGNGNFNMLSFGIGFLDTDGKYPKVRVMLKNENAKTPPTDENGKEYSREEAAELLALALLNGNGINIYLFENADNDGGITISGNARINIFGIELGKEQNEPVHTPKKTAKPKPSYVVPPAEAEDDEEPNLPY